MFVQAIEMAAKFTRAVHTITRYYKSPEVERGTATLFFVNPDGWALTCAHAVNLLATGGALKRKMENFKKELSERQGTLKERKLLNELEKKYGYSTSAPYELHNRLIGCVEGNIKLRRIKHPEIDVALIKFDDYDRLLCDTFPIFPADTSSLQQGKYLCRLGFPFPEFTNYTYDEQNDQLLWTDTGRAETPRFPIEGMLTRHVVDNRGDITGFELSTPGLRGQSGGPAFDTEGKIWGMQSQTVHLDLDFDIDQEVIRGGKRIRVYNNVFLHVGRCVHVDILKSFMRDNGVQFQEA